MALTQGGIDAIKRNLAELRLKRMRLVAERDVRTEVIQRLQAEKADYITQIAAVNADIATIKADLPEVGDTEA
jgi:ABC-type phosphate transport system auxiliary subunit